MLRALLFVWIAGGLGLAGCRSIAYQPAMLVAPPDSARRLDALLSAGSNLGLALCLLEAQAQWRPSEHLTLGARGGFWQRHDSYLPENGFGSSHAAEYRHYTRWGRSAGLNGGYLRRWGQAQGFALGGLEYERIGRSYETVSTSVESGPYAYSLWQDYQYLKPWAQLGLRLPAGKPGAAVVLMALRMSYYTQLAGRQSLGGPDPDQARTPPRTMWMPQASLGLERCWHGFVAGGQLQLCFTRSYGGDGWWLSLPAGAFAYAGYRFGTPRRGRP